MKRQISTLLIPLLLAYNGSCGASDLRSMASPRPPSQEAPISQCGAQERKLQACAKLVRAQDLSIVNLKQANSKLSNKVIELTSPPIIPSWVLPLSVFMLGVFVGSKL